MGCSHAFTKNNRVIKGPYDRMLAKYMLCWQIYNYVKNRELSLLYRDYSGYNFMPGVREGYMPSARSGKKAERDARIIALYQELVNNGDGWKGTWLGMSYTEAKASWELLKETESIPGFDSEVLKNAPQVGSMLPADMKLKLDEYYTQLTKSDPLFAIKIKKPSIPRAATSCKKTSGETGRRVRIETKSETEMTSGNVDEDSSDAEAEVASDAEDESDAEDGIASDAEVEVEVEVTSDAEEGDSPSNADAALDPDADADGEDDEADIVYDANEPGLASPVSSMLTNISEDVLMTDSQIHAMDVDYEGASMFSFFLPSTTCLT